MKLPILHAALLLPLLWGCDWSDKSAGTNDETTTSLATIYRPDGKPAAGARVLVYSAGDTQTAAKATGIVDANGQVVLPATPAKGWYNLVVRDGSGRALLEDSILSDGNRLTVFSDTLRRTGKLIGRIRVQPQDKPSIAWAQLLGAGRYMNLDDSGRFTIDSIPSGKYTLAGLTRAELYTPTFRELRIAPDTVVDIGTIDLIYTGVPMVTDVHAVWDSLHSTATVTWTAIKAPDILGYQILRGSNSDPGSATFVDYVTGSASWTDTLFAGRTQGGSLGSLFDSVETDLFYRVVPVANKGNGPASLPDSLHVRSPILLSQWQLEWTSHALPRDIGGARIDSLGEGLATLSTTDSTRLWTSPDGSGWSKRMSFGIDGPAPVFWKSSLWWTTSRETGRFDTLFVNYDSSWVNRVQYVDTLIVHRFDGSVFDSIAIAVKGDSTTSGALVALGDSLALLETQSRFAWAVSMGYSTFEAVWSSPNGANWHRAHDSLAWWEQSTRSASYAWYGPGVTKRPGATFGTSVPVFTFGDGSDSSAIWTNSALDEPGPFIPRQFPSGPGIETVPPIASVAAVDSTLLVVSYQTLRWTRPSAPTRWHRISSPSATLRQVGAWRGQILVHDGNSLWMAPIPVTP